MARPQSGITLGFKLAIHGSRRHATPYWCRLPLTFRPLCGLSKQPPTGREHIAVYPYPSSWPINPQRHPTSGRKAPGSEASLQRSLLGPVSERENAKTPFVRQASHRVNRKGEADLRIR
jgi:hypothetical protein